MDFVHNPYRCDPLRVGMYAYNPNIDLLILPYLLGPKKKIFSFPVTRPTLSVRPTLNVFIDFETGQFIYYHQKHSACQRVGSGMHSLARSPPWPLFILLCASGGHSPGGAIVVPFIDLNVNRCSWWMYMWCLGIVFTCFIQ